MTRGALEAFTQRLVAHVAPERVILFGSMARGEARWDSDADILVVMPFEGPSRDMVNRIAPGPSPRPARCATACAVGLTAWKRCP